MGKCKKCDKERKFINHPIYEAVKPSRKGWNNAGWDKEQAFENPSQ